MSAYFLRWLGIAPTSVERDFYLSPPSRRNRFRRMLREHALDAGGRVKEFPAVFVFPWGSDPLAREIPDIFIPLARNRIPE